jgi:hypothetical protein
MSIPNTSAGLAIVAMGLLAGCVAVHRERERERPSSRVVEERTVVTPPSVHEERVIEKRRYEED